jgi:ribonuclease VapC
MTPCYAIDAWAVLALLQKEEPAASRVPHFLEEAGKGQCTVVMSIVNLGEVYYRVGKVRGDAEARQTLDQLRQLPVVYLSATDDLVMAAADLKMHHAIAYTDAFAAATAHTADAVLLTGDPELEQLAAVLPIEKLKRA